MQINPTSPQAPVQPAAQAAPKAPPPAAQPAQVKAKDTAFLSQKAKDLAAQLSGKTMQEEAKESPVVEMNEEASKAK